MRADLSNGVYATQPLPKNFGSPKKPFDPLAPPQDARVFITHRLTDSFGEPIENLLRWAESGGRVLLLSQGALPETASNFYRTVAYNMGSTGNMGTVIYDHPALDNFPHEGWCDFPFVDLIQGAYPMDLGAFAPHKIQPIIRSIGHHMNMLDKAYLFEIGIGEGVLLACSLHLQPHCYVHPAAEYLLGALIRYLAESDCRPPNLGRDPLLKIFLPEATTH